MIGSWGLLRLSLSLLGCSSEPLGALLGGSWSLLGASWAVLEVIQNDTKMTCQKRSTSRPKPGHTGTFVAPPKGAQNFRRVGPMLGSKSIFFGMLFLYCFGSPPRRPKRRRRGPKTPPRAPQEAPRGPQERPRRPQEEPKRPQEPVKRAQDPPRSPLKAPKDTEDA